MISNPEARPLKRRTSGRPMYRSKRSYVQVGFPQDAEVQQKDYAENQNSAVFTQTTRGVKGTNPLIMS